MSFPSSLILPKVVNILKDMQFNASHAALTCFQMCLTEYDYLTSR